MSCNPKVFGCAPFLSAIFLLSALPASCDQYAHEMRLTVKGHTGTEVSGFRLLVRVSEEIPGFMYSQSLSQGADFRFSLEDGTALPHECDTWNPAGESAFWVLVPSLTNGLVVCMRYGCAGDTPPDGSAVWGNDYAGVWHMNIANDAVAESAHGYHGIVSNPTQVQSGIGAVGGCYINPSKTTGTVPCVHVGDTNGSYTAFSACTGEVSFSAWIRYDGQSGAGKWGRWWNTNGGGDVYTGMYGLDYALEGSATVVTLADKGTRTPTTCPSLAGDWHHFVVSYSGGHRTVYIDGEEFPSFDNCDTASYAPPPWAAEWRFGARKILDTGNDEQWVGGLDEFRAQKSATSAAQAAAEYEMVKDGIDYLLYERVLTDYERAEYTHAYTLFVNGFDGPPITDYRLLVRLSSAAVPGFDPVDSLTAGGDFVFTTEHGIVLPHELDTWNSDGESTFWVRVPRMEHGIALKMYYGKAGESASYSHAVWSGYVGVWHMNIVDDAVRESANGFHGMVSNSSQVVASTGRVGGAYLNPSQTSGDMPCVSVGDTNGAFAAFNVLTGNVSFSAWIKYTGNATSGKYGRWWCTSGGLATSKCMSGLDYSLEGSATRISVTDYGDRAANKAVANLADWRNVVVQYSGGHRTVYVDGIEMPDFDNCDSAAYVPRTNTRWVFGSRVDAGAGTYEQWVGGLDEFRAYPGLLEPERIRAEFRMVASDASYIRFVNESDDKVFLKYADIIVSGYAGGTVLTNFPLCVRVSPQTIQGFRYSDLRADGRDLIFSTTNGVPLDFEVDTWNPSGESVYWVRVPELSNGTVVRMNFGCATAANNGGVMGAVWADYAGVWHVNEIMNGAIAVADSSPTASTSVGGANSAATNGVFGLSRGSRLTGKNGPSAFSVEYAAKLDVGETFTVSLYLRRGVVNAAWAYLATRKVDDDNWGAWGVQSRSSLGLRPGFWSGADSPAPSSVYAFADADVDTWHKVDIIYDGFDRILYVDGDKVAEETKSTKANSGTKGLSFGGPTNFSGTFPGDMDEIRYYSGRKSDAWIKAEYDMSGLSGGTPFLSYGHARRFNPVGVLIIIR